MEFPTLSLDMLFEIFSRTSLQTIGRCRLVSKDLNSITYDSNFMQAFHQRTKTISGFFIQSMSQFVSNSLTDDSTVSLKFLPAPVKIEAATKQGILLCVNKDNPRRYRIPEYYVCKPSTKEWHQIPNPKTRFFTQRIGMVVLRLEPLCYKIVRFSSPKSKWTNYKSKLYNTLHCEVYSSETCAWKRLGNVLLPWIEYLRWEPAVSSCGALHWLMTNHEIFTFFADTESWEIFDLPFPLCKEHYFKHMKLVDYSGHLAMLCMEDSSMQLWVMEDSETKKWSKRQNISIKAIQEVERYPRPVSFESSDIILIEGFCRLILYNFKSCSVNVRKIGINFDQSTEIFPFQSDSEPMHLKNYWKKEQLSTTKIGRRNSYPKFFGCLACFSAIVYIIFVCNR
ncbi:F-box protein At5g49610-like [Corylus avellana]|uniref:F-box protein At5g49610-like n=1 Tax=Corylus avellana TaxID=13451 RepID=UPI00286C9800|nr:F-box protein At5g49610-like [Corylus avellana]